MVKTKNQINEIDVYEIKCPHCYTIHEGRFAYPSFVGADGRYCNKCPNLKIWTEDDPRGLDSCECGGLFNSYILFCPVCRKSIENAEKQLAIQFYIVQPCLDPDNPSENEIDSWYKERKNVKFFTGTELFIQLSLSLIHI